MVKRDKFYIWGASLVILGYLIGLNPYWWIFGTPVIYVAGVFLVWFSKKTTIIKVLYTLLPLVFWLPGFWMFIYAGSEQKTPETFLIPDHFRGKITLYYGESCGEVVQKENGRLIYHIPKDGTMIINYPLETGIIDEDFFFVDSLGRIIKKIDRLDQRDFNESYTLEKNKHEPPRSQVAVFLGGTGGSGTVNGFDDEHYKFHELYVDSYDSLRVYNEMKTDSQSMHLLKSCRIKVK